MVSTLKKKGTGIVSAARGDNTKKQTTASDKLVKRIKGAGLPGPKKVSGVYHEKDIDQKEKSFIVSSESRVRRDSKKPCRSWVSRWSQTKEKPTC